MLSYLIVLGIQIIQIVIAFIPGQFIEMAAATIYSPIVALVILELGLVTATIIIYYLGKWIGKPFIELFLNGVQLTHDLEDEVYRIYNNNNFIGLGIVKNKLLKRDIVI